MNVLQTARIVRAGELFKQITKVSSCNQLKYSLQNEEPDIWRAKSSSAGISLALPQENLPKLHQQTELKTCKEADPSSCSTDKMSKIDKKKLPIVVHKANTKHILYKDLKKYLLKKFKELYYQEYKYKPPKYHIPATKMSIMVDHCLLKRKVTLKLHHFVVPMEEQERVTPKKKDSECICKRHKMLYVKVEELKTSNENKAKQTTSKQSEHI